MYQPVSQDNPCPGGVPALLADQRAGRGRTVPGGWAGGRAGGQAKHLSLVAVSRPARLIRGGRPAEAYVIFADQA
jgi:hypothetical protein